MIEVYEPMLGKEELEYVVDAIKKGQISGGFGEYLDKFENQFADFCGVKHGIAVSSGTTALHLAVEVAGISHGDEVLMSASTNIATALGVIHKGAIPVPVDSENTTWNLNINLIESLITEKTKAIIPVHLFGHPVDMDHLMKIANKHELTVIEDCAEAHGSTIRGRMVGSFGSMSCFSFYANKVITTGEGGMVVTNDDQLAKKLRLYRNLGFTNPRFRHDIAGYNFRMTNLQAAMGLAQLHKIDHILSEKRRVTDTYNKYLKSVTGLQLPTELDWAKNVYWMYALTIESTFGVTRDELVKALHEKDIQTRTFFCPMNIQPVIKSIKGYNNLSCPVAERIWETGLYLPSGPNLNEDDIMYICESIKELV
jgi:perosamine synthetase